MTLTTEQIAIGVGVVFFVAWLIGFLLGRSSMRVRFMVLANQISLPQEWKEKLFR